MFVDKALVLEAFKESHMIILFICELIHKDMTENILPVNCYVDS